MKIHFLFLFTDKLIIDTHEDMPVVPRKGEDINISFLGDRAQEAAKALGIKSDWLNMDISGTVQDVVYFKDKDSFHTTVIVDFTFLKDTL